MNKPKRKKIKSLPGSKVKLSFKKHILPPLAGLMAAVAVFGFFNSQFLSARIAYYVHAHQAVTTTVSPPAATVAHVDPTAPPQIVINKINVKAPINFNLDAVNEGAFQLALRDGVVHYPGTAVPGQTGNVVIFGHSSGQWWAPGHYKFVFTLLDKLTYGDTMYIDYQGIRYTYQVTTISVVKPTDLSVLNQGSEHNLTLITCTPVGTSAKRLIIRANQTSPAVTAPVIDDKPASLPPTAQGDLPGNSSSFWHDLTSLF